jgi:hypothetical protein
VVDDEQPSWFHVTREDPNRLFGIGRVLNHSEANDDVELIGGDRKPEQVGLADEI